MSKTTKIYPSLLFRGVLALFIGVGVVSFAVAKLGTSLSNGVESRTVTARYTVDLKQDADMLKALSDQLAQGTDVVGGAETLNEIAPAAGTPLGK